MNTADIIINLVSSHSWAVLLFMVLSLTNNLLSSNSKFPVNPPTWLVPLLTIIVGQLLAVAAAWAAHLSVLYPAIDAGLTSLVAISTSHAIWTHGAPGWMQWLGMLAQTLQSTVPPTPPAPPAPPTPPAPPPIVGGMMVMVIALVVLPPTFSAITQKPSDDFQILTSCTPATQKEVNTVISQGLNAIQFLCLETGDFGSAQDGAIACGIISAADKLAPDVEAFIDEIINQGKLLKQAGYRFDKPSAKWIKQ